MRSSAAPSRRPRPDPTSVADTARPRARRGAPAPGRRPLRTARRVAVGALALLLALVAPTAPGGRPAAATPAGTNGTALPEQRNGGDRLYVGSANPDAVLVVDPAAGDVVRTVPVDAPPSDLAASPDGGRVYALTRAGAQAVVTVIDTADGGVVATFPARDRDAFYLDVTSDGSMLVVKAVAGDTLTVLDAATGELHGTVDLGVRTLRPVSTDDGRTLLPAAAAPEVLVVDAAELSVGTARLPSPAALLRPTGGRLLLVDQGDQRLLRDLDAGTFEVLWEARTEVAHGDAAVSAGPDDPVYAVRVDEDAVSAVDRETGAASAVPVGAGPTALAVSGDGRRVFALNARESSISVIDAAAGEVSATLDLPGEHAPVMTHLVRAGSG
ncbi:PQQ-binding-like beta-propeller repeat protein [Actinoalloteichus caeruleus]|uniref:DNA-binding beta-propeller fold protein YncE n=1 Tax=Actinoalloteichus caeruleus DSM 43889 TaxID=1120930 RepID=A0ABT1JI94_ACTCY|nr:PQQ-binding-like beta-propeller repeat protein [Actinoalloteichus caeruleus]MCP2331481.1 DNA-binding beta-propeller fold protein YncE [Actinoalloteichus caeruleus DSM 43889]